MKTTINIIGLVGGWDLPTFKVSDNEDLTVAFEGLHMSQLYRYIATFKLGKATAVITLDKDLTATVNADFLNTYGDTLEVFLEARSARTDRLLIEADPNKGGFIIEPLKLIKYDSEWTAVGMVQELVRQYEELDERVSAVEETLREFKEGGVPLPVHAGFEDTVEVEEPVEIDEE